MQNQKQEDLWKLIQQHLLQFHKTFIEYLLYVNDDDDNYDIPLTNVQLLAVRYVKAVQQYRQAKFTHELTQLTQMISWVHNQRMNVDPQSDKNVTDRLQKLHLFTALEYRNKRELYLNLVAARRSGS